DGATGTIRGLRPRGRAEGPPLRAPPGSLPVFIHHALSRPVAVERAETAPFAQVARAVGREARPRVFAIGRAPLPHRIRRGAAAGARSPAATCRSKAAAGIRRSRSNRA